MAEHKAVLIAEDAHYEHLLQDKILDQTLFTTRADFRESRGQLIHLTPEFMGSRESISGEGGKLDVLEDLESLFSLFIEEAGGTIVYRLAVLGESGADPDSDEYIPEKDWDDLLDWHIRFHALSKRILGLRAKDLKHVLILVCAREIHPDHFDKVQKLMGLDGHERLFRACYMMQRRMTWGNREVFHARQIWSIAVSRMLLVHLCDEGFGETLKKDKLVEGNASRLYAWRALDLSLGDESKLTPLTNRLHEKFWKRLQESSKDKLTWDANEKFPMGDDGKQGESPWSGDSSNRGSEVERITINNWMSFEPEAEVRKELEHLSIVARESAARTKTWSSNRQRKLWDDVHHATNEVWREQVREGIRHIAHCKESSLTSISRRIEKFKGKQIEIDWEEVAGLQDKMEETERDAYEAAKLLAEMRSHFLPWYVRVVICATPVLIAAVWVSVIILWQGLGIAWEAVAVAIAAVLGCFFAVTGIHFWESWGGKKAAYAFRRIYLDEGICQLFKRIQSALLDSVNASLLNSEKRWSFAFLKRSYILISRIHQILHGGLVYKEHLTQSSRQSILAPKDVQTREEQRSNYLGTTRVLIGFDHEELEQELDDIVEDLMTVAGEQKVLHSLGFAQMEAFPQRFKEFCEENDIDANGNLPFWALWEFIQIFKKDLREIAASLVWKSIGKDKSDEIRNVWLDKINPTEQNVPYLSVDLTGTHINLEDEYTSRIYCKGRLDLGNEWKATDILASTHVQAIYYEQISFRIGLVKDQNDKINVGPMVPGRSGDSA